MKYLVLFLLCISFAKANTLHGINWFGFNNGQTMVDGLWAGGTSAACDYSVILFQLKLLGFNALRLPFTFNDLELSAINKTITCKVLTLEELYQRARTVPTTRKTLNITLDGTKCNTKMPNSGRTIDRFVWAINEAIKQDMRVIIDYHGMGSEPWVRNAKMFSKAWLDLWNYIKKRIPRANQYIIIDIFNEPDSMGFVWSDIANLYFGVMDVIQGPYFLIEGTGQTAWNMNWGDGFVTDPNIIRENGISDPRPFFDKLVKKPYVHRVIISPHIYGPSISKATEAYKGKDLWHRLDKSFGYLKTQGYKGIKFNVVVGEFGTKFEDIRDLELMHDFATWMKANNIDDWVFWNYAQNGADTLNLVKNNWQDINWRVVDWLKLEFDFGDTKALVTNPNVLNINPLSVISMLANLLGLRW